ncbi:MAG: DUF1801 domain-containing protein [Verrucomicrobia bacterium]|nr:DUF1801 domain-containing protein [Verrucomicrobiota bacterium]MBI3867002.1 DUF1801 domain-containing protein [Verrucomicrobiota bacterium]
MRALFRLHDAAARHPAVQLWRDEHQDPLGAMATRWFEAMRHCGEDVREVLHDGQPTACVGGAAFAYVDAFASHVNIGFFQGAELPDPQGLLQGAGKFMRHVKLRPGEEVDVAALSALIDAAYTDVKARLAAE